MLEASSTTFINMTGSLFIPESARIWKTGITLSGKSRSLAACAGSFFILNSYASSLMRVIILGNSG
jgi:hypothetical protein